MTGWFWAIWASDADVPDSPPNPRVGDQWIRGEHWFVWNGLRWKLADRPRAFRPDLEESE